jgi:hypothetical protein
LSPFITHHQGETQMRLRRFATLTATASALVIAAATTSVFAQGQPRPGPGQPPAQQQPKAVPPKPYKPVAISAPQPINDPAFVNFFKQISDVAKKKDRAGLAKLTVAQGFFWMGDNGDKADKKKPSIDNLAKALDLGSKDGAGWEALDGFVSDPTASPLPERKDVLCAPADPVFDDKAFEALVTSSGTPDWGYPTQPGVEVRGGPQPNAPVIEKLGMYFVRVMQDENPPAAPQNQMPPMKVVTPSGKVGYVAGDLISPLGNDQLCFAKDAGGWKITGFVGGDQQ